MLFETKRLKLRRFTIEDAEAVLAINSNEEVIKLTGDKLITTIAVAKEIINEIWLPEYEKYGYARMAVVHKKDKKVIGFSGLKYESEFNATDIGYRLLPQYWGKGLATESAIPFLFYGFQVLKIPKIVGVAVTENKASCKVLENLGLQFIKQGNLFNDGINYKWYELLKEDYQSIAQSKRSKK
jgi:RimJ/RimL family protein N-acetyltransferase